MFLVRFPTAAQPQKQKTPPPLVPPRTFIPIGRCLSEAVHQGLFFSPLQDLVSSIIFWGTNRFPNWVVFAVGPLKVFDRMGDQAKIHISLNVSLQNTMGSHAPFFYHAHFRSNEAGIGITRGTVSLSEISAVIVWYHGTNLSGQHTMVSFQKQWKMGKVCS